MQKIYEIIYKGTNNFKVYIGQTLDKDDFDDSGYNMEIINE